MKCFIHLDIWQDLVKLIKAIDDDTSDVEYHVKIKDYVCSINKGYFVSSPHKGLDALVKAIVRVSEFVLPKK